MSEVPSVVIQPVLQMSVDTAAKIASGKAYVVGGVVREVGTARLVELLSDAPDLGTVADKAARSMGKGRISMFDLSKLPTPKVEARAAIMAGGVLLVVGAVVGGYQWAASRRNESTAADGADHTVEDILDAGIDDPTCLVEFRASLEAYVDAGKTGSLTEEIIGSLVADLDSVQAYADDGNAIVFTLEELLPFFGLVAAHTPVLAAAYRVDVDDTDKADDDVVVALRRHLEAQRSIVGSAA